MRRPIYFILDSSFYKLKFQKLRINASNVTIETLMRVFNAIQAKVMLQIELPHFKINLGQ